MRYFKLFGLAIAAYVIGRVAVKYGLPFVARIPVVGPAAANVIA